MNLFRLAGDMTHLLSIIVLLLKIRTMKSCAATLYLYMVESFSVLFQRTKFYCWVMFEDDRLPKLRGRWEYGHLLSIRLGALYCMYSILNSEKSGISLKTQELYIVVFATRYLDLFTRHVSYYNTIMKLVFLGTSIAIVWYMRYHKVVKQTYNKDEDTFKHYFLIPPCFVLALMVHHAFNVVEVLWSFSLYLEAVAILPQLVLLQRSRNIDNLTGNYVFLLGAYRGLYLINWIYRFFMEKPQVRWIPWLSGLVQTALYADFFYYYIQSWKNHKKLKLPA